MDMENRFRCLEGLDVEGREEDAIETTSEGVEHDACEKNTSRKGRPKDQRKTAKNESQNHTALSCSKAKYLDQAIVWIDLEMTGLDVENHTILEIACLVTDGKLNRVVEGPSLVIHQSDEVLAAMNEWCVENHGKSGLTQRVRESTISIEEAEEQVLHFIEQFVPPGQAPLAGNSVHADLAFLKRYMPKVANYLHYRIVDVSTVQELAMRWNSKTAKKAPKKTMRHTALSDIYESLEQLRFYKDSIFARR